MKICSKCKQEKPLDDFVKGSGGYGRKCYCKSCSMEVQREHRSNPEVKAHYAELARNKRRSNPAKALLDGCRSRAKLLNIPFDITIDDILIPELCPVLGVPIVIGAIGRREWYSPSVDRIDPSKGYVKGNVMVMSMKANAMKLNSTPEELQAFCEFFIRK